MRATLAALLIGLLLTLGCPAEPIVRTFAIEQLAEGNIVIAIHTRRSYGIDNPLFAPTAATARDVIATAFANTSHLPYDAGGWDCDDQARDLHNEVCKLYAECPIDGAQAFAAFQVMIRAEPGFHVVVAILTSDEGLLFFEGAFGTEVSYEFSVIDIL